jgi:hypothetical protein
MLNKKEILNRVEEFCSYEIVKKALEAWKDWGGLKNGYAVYDPDIDELVGVALGNGEWIPNDNSIYLYEVPANVWDTITDEDMLLPDELEDYKARIKAGEELTVGEYIEKYTDDNVYDRLVEVLESYFELDWDDIERQVDEILNI